MCARVCWGRRGGVYECLYTRERWYHRFRCGGVFVGRTCEEIKERGRETRVSKTPRKRRGTATAVEWHIQCVSLRHQLLLTSCCFFRLLVSQLSRGIRLLELEAVACKENDKSLCTTPRSFSIQQQQQHRVGQTTCVPSPHISREKAPEGASNLVKQNKRSKVELCTTCSCADTGHFHCSLCYTYVSRRQIE